MKTLARSSLSSPRGMLIEWMQHLGFGTIEGLAIRSGEPVVDPRPRLIRDVKFCSQNGPRAESDLHDYVLKAQVRDLLTHFDSLGDVTILRIEVKHGLPFRMQVEETKV